MNKKKKKKKYVKKETTIEEKKKEFRGWDSEQKFVRTNRKCERDRACAREDMIVNTDEFLQ